MVTSNAKSAAIGRRSSLKGAMHPFNCLAEPLDVANLALFLASDKSRLINAADLVIDGAKLAQ